MCFVDAHDKLHTTYYGSLSSGSGSPLPDGSTTYMMKSLCNTFNFIDIWLQKFEINCVLHWDSYKEKINELFKNIPQTLPITKPCEFKKKLHSLLTEIGGKFYVNEFN